VAHNRAGMAPAVLVRYSGAALALGGICLALFMIVHPYGEIAGAHAAHSARWVPAHSLHFVGALATLLGLPGLYARGMRETGRLGLVGALLAMAGMAMFVGTGMITAFIWPVIAETTPGFVAADGPMFADPLPTFATDAPYVTMIAGFVLFAIASIRSRTLPTETAVVLAIGVVLFSSPVQPVGPLPFAFRLAGAIAFGGALAWTGWLLWQRPLPDQPSPARYRSARRAGRKK
jgi:hypothetical protein